MISLMLDQRIVELFLYKTFNILILSNSDVRYYIFYKSLKFKLLTFSPRHLVV